MLVPVELRSAEIVRLEPTGRNVVVENQETGSRRFFPLERITGIGHVPIDCLVKEDYSICIKRFIYETEPGI